MAVSSIEALSGWPHAARLLALRGQLTSHPPPPPAQKDTPDPDCLLFSYMTAMG
jgi:hypothetical protein